MTLEERKEADVSESEVSVTYSVRLPRDLYERMKRHREINWSEVIRRSIEEHLEGLEKGEKITIILREDLVEFARHVRKYVEASEEPSEVLSRERERFGSEG